MSEVTQAIQESKFWWHKINNCLMENPFLKNNAFFKVVFKAVFSALTELHIDKISEDAKKANLLYKQLDDDEKMDENQRKIKNALGEILKKMNLFLKKFDECKDEDLEGENEKMLKNKLMEVFKLTQPFFQNFDEIQKEQK